MALPLKYSLRNVFVRWRSTLATILGVAAVVFVWVLMQALAAGLEKAAASTGDPRNLLVVRKGADSESTSQINVEDLRSIQYADEIARDENGRPLVSADALVVAYLQRSSGTGGANVIFRGISANGAALRPQVKLADGRWFSPGKREATVSVRLARRFTGISSTTSTRVVSVSPTITGRVNLICCVSQSAPGPGISIPSTAETRPAESIPCAMRPPKRLLLAISSSTWSGLKSSVSSAYARTSASLTTRVRSAAIPTVISSYRMVRPP